MEPLVGGFGRSDITPSPTFPNGMWMAQTHLRGAGIHRPLSVSAVHLAGGGEQVVLLVFDLTILSHRQVGAIREAVSVRTGIAPERVWLYVTHTHAGPVSQDFYDREGADEVRAYVAALPARAAEAAAQAVESARPARVGSGSGTCRIGVNRDLRHGDRVITGPNPDGLTDPRVDVLRIDATDGSPIAALVTYGSHPTYLGPGNELISPDYPGVTRAVFESVVGAPCAFLLAGAGNVGPLRGFDSTTEFVERDGTILALEAAKTFLEIDTASTETYLATVIESGAPLALLAERPRATPPATLRVAVRRAALPTGNPGATVYDTAAADVEEAEARVAALRARGAPDDELGHATQQALRHRLRLDRRDAYLAGTTYDVAVRAFSIGETAFVSLECEAYAELALAVRERSPFAGTVFAAYEGADVIYVVPADHYAPPVPMQVFNSPFAPDAADVLVDEAVATLEALVEGARRP